MFRKAFLWMQTYERHLSAFAMIAGFIFDNLFFRRIDLWETQAVFASYIAICFLAIPLMHFAESRARPDIERPRFRILLTLATQFALGGLWSGFVIFYGRSAVFGASWPFLIFLFLVFLGNEYFYRYHQRLVFTSILFFFALYSYAIFAVPLFTGTIGTLTFLLSGAVAIGVFIAFTTLLRIFARERFSTDISRIRIGAAAVLLAVNVFYFTNILPPLPLSAETGGIYHAVSRAPGAYFGESEAQPWLVRYLGFTPTLNVVAGESLSAYSSVFAPTTLKATITHRWQWYDEMQKAWVTKAVISYQIVGGRDGGYRGYSTSAITEEGKWRVNIETADGRLIDRIPFVAEKASVPAPVETIRLE